MASVTPVQSTPPPRPARVSLASMAGDAWDAADGDFAAAVEYLITTLLSSDEALRGIVGEVAYDSIRDEMRRRRAAYFPNTSVPMRATIDPIEQGRAFRAAMQTTGRDWLRFPLCPGVLLGDATRPQILAQISEHERNIRTNALRIRILKPITERMPNDVVHVADVLTHDDIQRIADGDANEKV